MGIRVIDRQTVRRLLTWEAAIPLMREAMMALSAGRTGQLLRQLLPIEGGVLAVMPGATPEVFGAKLISVMPGNFDKGIASHQGGVLLFEPESGAPVALLHAGEITAIRTAAASAAATDVLARPDAARLAILGYGEQAETHAHAVAHVRKLAGVTVWGRSAERARAFADRLAPQLGVPVTPAAGVEAAVAEADIVCAVTGAREPILFGAAVAAGAHVNLAGASGLGPREADDDLIVRGRIFADHREGVLRQSGEVVHAIEAGLIGEGHVLGEIGEVMAGAKAGRLTAEDVTIYKSLGAIVQDLASGWYVYRRAMQDGLGTDASF